MSLLDQIPPVLTGTKRTVMAPDILPRRSPRELMLRELVAEYYADGATSAQIGVALGVTERWARELLIELGLHRARRFTSPSHFIEWLSRDSIKRERLERFRNGTVK